MALYALRLAGVDDWRHFADPAREWLWTQQQPDGYWLEKGTPDPVWLTVIVLDAIELASDGTNVTFTLEFALNAPLVFVANQHNDTQWLEELKIIWVPLSTVEGSSFLMTAKLVEVRNGILR